ncbi:hypothetical protein ACTXG7_16080 [Mycolicibacterium sp. Dal123E01]|uniref:hypothetical protein n=1 Tax=Mycolicibacterium sp. Dal123E01 TaxID=3457578 RepID=UPI00403E4E84
MRRRIGQVLLGLYWSVCGALMALNPPPPGFRRSAALPWIGWLVIAAALYIAVNAVATRDQATLPSGRPPRHARGEPTSMTDSLKVIGAAVLGPLAGGWAIWWGITDGYVSMVGLGLAVLPLAAAGVPLLIAAARS